MLFDEEREKVGRSRIRLVDSRALLRLGRSDGHGGEKMTTQTSGLCTSDASYPFLTQDFIGNDLRETEVQTGQWVQFLPRGRDPAECVIWGTRR